LQSYIWPRLIVLHLCSHISFVIGALEIFYDDDDDDDDDVDVDDDDDDDDLCTVMIY